MHPARVRNALRAPLTSARPCADEPQGGGHLCRERHADLWSHCVELRGALRGSASRCLSLAVAVSSPICRRARAGEVRVLIMSPDAQFIAVAVNQPTGSAVVAWRRGTVKACGLAAWSAARATVRVGLSGTCAQPMLVRLVPQRVHSLSFRPDSDGVLCVAGENYLRALRVRGRGVCVAACVRVCDVVADG